jgi:Ca2+/Na+ antiporter
MNEKLRGHIDELFEKAPKTVKMAELKEEMLQNLTDKYNDLLGEGKSEDAAYHIAVASIGDISGLIGENQQEEAAAAGQNKRSGILVSIAVSIYILCVVPCLLLQNELGVALMLVMAALATFLLIYNSYTRHRYIKRDDTMVEEFKAWKSDSKQDRRAEKAVTGAMWLIITCAYFFLSFLTGSWHISWLVFLIGAALTMVIRGIFDLKR